MQARFVQQGASVDYLPDANVPAGSIVVVNDLVGVARIDLKAGEPGALAVSPAPVFEVEKGAAVALSMRTRTRLTWAGTGRGASPAPWTRTSSST